MGAGNTVGNALWADFSGYFGFFSGHIRAYSLGVSFIGVNIGYVHYNYRALVPEAHCGEGF